MVKKSILKYVSPLFLLLLFAACTQNDMKVDTAKNEEATARSTQAECDSIQSNFPGEATSIKQYCMDFTTLFECRLNQGVDESNVIANCIRIDDYTFTPDCITASDLFFNYQTLVNQYRTEVYQNTSPCPTTICPPPQNQQACRILIFSTSYAGSSCPGDGCRIIVKATVYCCP